MILFLTALLSTAGAFDSVCHLPDGTKCKDGYQPPRNRWNNEESEHGVIFADALARSGLPSRLGDDFSLRTFAQDLTLTGEATGLTYDSVKPVDFGAERTRTRTMSVPEFAALPDFSYSLTDWVTGNEGCDPYSDTDFERCHQFTTHMGALNSSHFVPQSRRFYEHYHLLALDRAAACAALEDSLEAAQPGAADRFESVLLACETEAMVLEAIGQHYLQDAWSMGHMWERWGGPELADHPEGLAAAQVIGATAGIIHGAKALIPFADDPMCAPHEDVTYLDETDLSEVHGAGDLFWASFLEDGENPLHTEQTAALLGCTINSMREVYEQTHQRHGLMLESTDALADLSRDPMSDACWGQRATNRAVATGFNLHLLGSAPLTSPVLIPSAFADLLSSLTPYSAIFSGGELLTSSQRAQYQRDTLHNFGHAQFRARKAPDDTDLAEGGMLPILGSEVNSHYERGELIDGSAPAAYLEPELPWGLRSTDDRATLLHLGFATSHAADRCLDLNASDLEQLQREATVAQGTTDAAAACGLCTQMVSPFIRIGASATDYDTDREPLCGLVEPSAEFVYTGTRAVVGNNAAAAGQWCGCSGRLAVTTRGSAPGLALFARAHAGLNAMAPGPSASPGDVFPTSDSARVAAIGGPYGDLALVGANSGTLSAFELIEGAEAELDWDADPSTTDAGAPGGITRVVLGAAPRQIAHLHTARYALITTEAGLEIVDLDTLVPVDTLTAADLGLSGSERAYGVAVTDDDTIAFVSIWGGTGAPATSEVLVIDLTDLLAGGAPDASWIIASLNTGSGTNNQILGVSHDGAILAVVCPDTDDVRLLSTSSPYAAIDTLTEASFFNPSQNPIDLAWAPDDSAVYVGYIGGPVGSSIETNGNVRRCDLATPDNCEHAVAVTGTIRSIALAGEGSDLVVWAADSMGGLTGLPAALFEPSATTSGVDGAGILDGTGGCLSSGRALACAAAANLGQAAGDMVIWGD